jgi:deoxyribose-phosphate aldolase
VDPSYTTRMHTLARRLLSLCDLTSLNATDDEHTIQRLLKTASSDAGKVAAVCCWPRFIPVAAPALKDTGIALAVVTNFPDGAADAQAAAAQSAQAVTDGANEIDVVFPYRALLAGAKSAGAVLVRACRDACADKALL